MDAMTFGLLAVSGVFLVIYLRRRRNRLSKEAE